MNGYTGFLDIDENKINFGDRVNICFTTEGGEFLHDCVYIAQKGHLGGLEFYFDSLLWEDCGHNQFPISMTLCEKYKTLSCVFEEGKKMLIVTSEEYINGVAREYPFNNEKVFARCSRYFKLMEK